MFSSTKMTRPRYLLTIILFLFSAWTFAKNTIYIKNNEADVTSKLRQVIEQNTDGDLKLVFERGIYRFNNNYALERYSLITNHSNGLKKVIFRIENLKSFEIEGNGSEFIFSGQVAPFQIDNCKKINIQNLTIDWDIPFLFQGEVLAVNRNEGWWEFKPLIKGYSWVFKNNKISFPNIEGFKYHSFGQTLTFDPLTKSVFHGDFTFENDPDKIEKATDSTFRFYQKLKNFPSVGSIFASKGDRQSDRYAPAFQMLNSSNVLIKKVVVHHALGMAFLFERTSDIQILNSGVYVREGSSRVISSTADATHFANCKGKILIENCRIESMLDDGTNVHGTYVTVDRIINPKTVRVALEHFEQMGFKFVGVGDEVWFILQPNPQRGEVNVVLNYKIINEKYIDITFIKDLPGGLQRGDILENKTWNPEFTMRGNSISKHRARNIIIKTPKKIVIENNYLSSDMSAIMLRGESNFWFESGGVEDVVIRNNHFENCAHGGAEHAVLKVSPVLSKVFDQNQTYDRNIRFENNLIETFDNRIFWGDRLDGLKIVENTIKQTKGLKQLYPDAPLFELKNCANIEISGNSYEGNASNILKADERTKKSLKMLNNLGF